MGGLAMSERTRCPMCHAPLPDQAPYGLCPRCLLRRGFEAESRSFDDVDMASSGLRNGGCRDGGVAVLDTIAATIGTVPRVLLHDTDPVAESGPVVRPASTEMPDPTERSARLHLFGEIARG